VKYRIIFLFLLKGSSHFEQRIGEIFASDKKARERLGNAGHPKGLRDFKGLKSYPPARILVYSHRFVITQNLGYFQSLI